MHWIECEIETMLKRPGQTFFTPIRNNRFLRGRSFRCRAYFCGIRLIRSYIQFLHFVCIPRSLIFQFELLFSICSFAAIMFVSIECGRATVILKFKSFFSLLFLYWICGIWWWKQTIELSSDMDNFLKSKKAWPDNLKIESCFQEYFIQKIRSIFLSKNYYSFFLIKKP